MPTSARSRTATSGSWISRICPARPPHGVDSNPIPPAGIADRGPHELRPHVFVNDELGLLFLNSANNGTTLGCQIFDLLQNPFDPPLIASWSGSGHDCHDSFARANVPGSGGKDLLYVGGRLRHRIASSTSPTCASSGTHHARRRVGPGVGHLRPQQLAGRRLALSLRVRGIQRPRHRRLRRLQPGEPDAGDDVPVLGRRHRQFARSTTARCGGNTC